MKTRKKIKTATEICKESGVTGIVLFGSAAKSEPAAANDIDRAVNSLRQCDIIDPAVL